MITIHIATTENESRLEIAKELLVIFRDNIFMSGVDMMTTAHFNHEVARLIKELEGYEEEL